jgi:hypothetical protein
MASLSDLLRDHPCLTLQTNNKILCSVTGHEMNPRPDVVGAHINGKKYLRSLEWYNYDYSEFLPYIIPDKSNEKKLFCRVSKQSLNKIPEEIRR